MRAIVGVRKEMRSFAAPEVSITITPASA